MLLDMITVRVFPQYCNNSIVSTYAFKNFKLHRNKAQLLKPMEILPWRTEKALEGAYCAKHA